MQNEEVPNIFDIGRVPDFVKDLRTFSGRPTELMSWVADVESIFILCGRCGIANGSLQLDLIEKTIRRKIVGEAADVLNANNILSSWADIKNTLILYYSDKRELKTLDFELSSIKKGSSESLSSYYGRVTELLSSIIAQIQTQEKYRLNATVHVDYFREKALDAFIRGLEKPLSVLLKTADPKSLAKAYQFCMEYHNLDIRSNNIKVEQNRPLPTPRPRELLNIPIRQPPIPPRIAPRFQPPPMPLPRRQQYFTPNLPSNEPSTSRFPPPTPMEVDRSIRSHQINYGNRPNFDYKRSRSPSGQIQHFKRQAHPLEHDDNYTGYYYTNSPEYYPEGYDYLDLEAEYYAQQQQQNKPQTQYKIPPDQLQHEQQQAHRPIRSSVHNQTQANDEITEQPVAANETESTAQNHFLEWKASW